MSRLAALSPIAVLMIGFLFSGCAILKLAATGKLKPPQLTYVRTDVKSVKADKAVVEFVFDVKNPNKAELKYVFMDYKLFHKGRKFVEGDDIAVMLAPEGVTTLSVPAELPYSGIFRTSGGLAKRVLEGHKTVPVRVDVVLHVKPAPFDMPKSGSLLTFKVALSRTVDIPLPVDEVKASAGEAAKEGLKKLNTKKKKKKK